mgnify:CR=1 FL=1
MPFNPPLTSYGCKEEDVTILKTHLYYYNIAIAFENQSGENLVEGIPYDEVPTVF